ncbi:MAG: DUF6293 family protein [Thermoplasmata archaeon]|nr:DUF6293 family protein [Thermoplasmata archaeon]
MPSGRKKRIMIACVTFETAKVTEPAVFYEINKVHIIHYVKDPQSDSGRIYGEFYDRVVELLDRDSPLDVEVVRHNERVSDFSTMLRTVLNIIQTEHGEGDCEIYVNISSGSPEYAAASAIAAMMVPGTIPFSVGTERYTVSNEAIREQYYVDGKPVGLTAKTYPPRTLPSYVIEMPEEHLVKGLRILHRRNEANLLVTSGKMVEALKEAGLWYRATDEVPEGRKSSQRQTEAVYYQRDFIAKWVRNGWAKRDELHNRYVLTDEGQIIISTFYIE